MTLNDLSHTTSQCDIHTGTDRLCGACTTTCGQFLPPGIRLTERNPSCDRCHTEGIDFDAYGVSDELVEYYASPLIRDDFDYRNGAWL